MKRRLLAPLVLACLAQPAFAATLADGVPFYGYQNPFIYNAGIRPSSDPSALQTQINGEWVTLLVTSSDLQIKFPTTLPDGRENYYPMAGVFLYARGSDGVWHDFGMIADELDMGFVQQRYQSVWAPDIHRIGDRYYLFVPGFDEPRQGQRIAVLHRDGDPFGRFQYDGEILLPGDGTGQVPNKGYMYDPGVFEANGRLYMVYCTDNAWAGRIHLTSLSRDNPADNSKVEYLGPIPVGGQGIPDEYAEGADVFTATVNGVSRLYLVFAAKLGASGDAVQEHLGYATCTTTEFASNPRGCWKFQGWIMKDIDPSPEGDGSSEWTNQGSLVSINGTGAEPLQHYLFYHYSQGDVVDPFPPTDKDKNRAQGQMRQISMRQIDFGSDGLIRGVSKDGVESLGHQEYPFADHPGDMSVVSPFTAMTADATFGDPSRLSPRIIIVNHTNTTYSATGFSYFFTAENGKTPRLENVQRPVPFYSATLVHEQGNQWRVDVWFQWRSSVTLKPGDTIPATGPGYAFDIRYDDYSAMDRTNDVSQPSGTGYTYTNRIRVSTTSATLGTSVAATPRTYHVLTQDSSGMAVTVPNTTNGPTVLGQPYHSTWSSQRWVFEPVLGTNYVRVRNVGYGDRYLNDGGASYDFKVSALDLNKSYASEQWEIVRQLGSKSFRLLNRDTGRYLTQPTWGEYTELQTTPFDHPRPWEQLWNLDSSRYNLRSDTNGNLLTATEVGSGDDPPETKVPVKGQPWSSEHWTSQDWIIEPIAGTNYFRLRNIYSAHPYLTDTGSGTVATQDLLSGPGDAQKWSWVSVNGRAYFQAAMKNKWTGRYLTQVGTGSYTDMTTTAQSGGIFSVNQIWAVVESRYNDQ